MFWFILFLVIYMGIITISMDKESENILRSTAKMMYGSRKDALSKTIVHSITKLRNERNEAVQNFMELFMKIVSLQLIYKSVCSFLTLIMN